MLKSPAWLLIILISTFLLNGCTMYFKATELEMQGEIVNAYKLSDIEIAGLDIPVPNVTPE